MNTTLSTIEPSITPKLVFIVEDDIFISGILTEKISNAHIEVKHFGSAEEAITALQTETPDVILLDIFLPGLNGLVALDQIRQNPQTKDTLVFVVSNTDEKKDRDEAERLGAHFIIKAATEPETILQSILAEYTKLKTPIA